MSVKIKTANTIKAELGINPKGRVHKHFTNSCALHMDKYLPFDTGTLAGTNEVGDDYIDYIQQYSEVVYYGVREGKELNYHTDKHPLAGPYWDKRMVSAEMKDIEREIKEYIGG